MKTRVRVALKLSSLSAEGKVVKAQSIKDSMMASGNFMATSMPISYTVLQTYITNLHNSNIAASNGTSTDVSHMHEQERILVNAFNFIKSFVEMTANNNIAPETIITSAGMQIAINGGQNAVTELTLDALGNGSLQVRVPRLTDEKAYLFESSTDGTTWTEFAASSLTKVELKNQTPGANIYIRFLSINKTGKSAYSQTKNTIVT